MNLSHFADWISPMLVKELRQGLRKSLFVATFFILQVAMIVLLGFRLLSSREGMSDLGDTVLDGLLFSALGIVTTLIMPLRGLTAISEERKANTLELVQLTNLNSLRIVLGKWVSIMALTLLIVVSILPYTVLRYFFGSVDIVDNLRSIGGMVLWSMILSAGAVWLSTMSVWVRGAVLGLVFLGTWIPGIMFASRMAVMSRTGGTVTGGGIFYFTAGADAIALVVGALFTTAFLLALAAARIAASSENHSAVYRSIALVAGFVSCLVIKLQPAWISVMFPIMIWSCCIAVCERTSDVPAVYGPFVRRGWLGKLGASVLTPGWATGLLHTLVIIAMLTFAGAINTKSSTLPVRMFLMWTMLFLSIVTPATVLVALPGVKQRGAFYGAAQLFCALLLMIALTLNVAATKTADLVATLIAATPTSAFLWAATHQEDASALEWSRIPQLTVPIGFLALAYLLLKSIPEWRTMRAMKLRAVSPDSDA